MPESVGDKTEIYAMVSVGHKEHAHEENSNYFVFAYVGMVDAAKQIAPDIKIEWHGPNAWDPAREVEAINALAARKVNGIIVSAVDQAVLTPAINAASQRGVPVITFDADAPESERLTFVGTHNYKAGYLAGKTMAAWLKNRGQVAISTLEHASHLDQRVAGFQAALREYAPDITTHVMHTGNVTIDELGQVDYRSSRQNYAKMLHAYPEIRGIFATFSSQGTGAALAVEDLKRQDTVTILAFDFDEETANLMQAGKIRGTVGQDPYLMGYVALILAHAASHAAEIPTKQAGDWRMTALTAFLNAHPTLNKNISEKLTRICSLLAGHPEASPPIPIDTGVEILKKDELLRVLARNFEDMRNSINAKVSDLQAEIEERKRAQEALQQLNAELEQRVQDRTAEVMRQKYILDTFLANVPDAIYFKDRDSRFLQVNQALATRLGLQDPAEALGKTDFDFFPAEHARPKYEAEQCIIRTGQPVLDQEEPDVGGYWSLTTKMPLRNEHGDIIGTFGISRDITELKKAQQELAVAYQEVQILNTHLQEDNLRMSAELDVSRRIQQMVLPSPKELEQIEGVDIVGYMQPADEVGGDYYDILKENDMLHIGIGDVTGHGLESGILMLMTQTAIRTLIEHGETDPVTFVNTLNRLIYKNVARMGADKNLTFALVQYRPGCFKLVGQHEEVLVVRQGGQVERVDTMDLGFPVGLEPEIAQWVHAITITLNPGDGLVLYTDGITEAENTAKQQYGIERLCRVISQHWHKPAEAVKQAVVRDLMAYIGAQTMYDDVTLVVLKQR